MSTWPTTDADLTLPEPGSPASLSRDLRFVVVVDTTVARVVTVNTSLASGVYGVGEEIMLTVTFTSAVGVNRCKYFDSFSIGLSHRNREKKKER